MSKETEERLKYLRKLKNQINETKIKLEQNPAIPSQPKREIVNHLRFHNGKYYSPVKGVDTMDYVHVAGVAYKAEKQVNNLRLSKENLFD